MLHFLLQLIYFTNVVTLQIYVLIEYMNQYT